MKLKNNRLFSVLSRFVLGAAIYVGIRPACAGTMYQPKAPKHLG